MMVRGPFYDYEKGVKKGAWSKEEDERLRAYIQRHGHSNWRQLPKLAGLARCGKSCRLRWLNYLRPDLKHGNYTPEEEHIIIKLHQQFGNRWSLIAEKLAGRTDSEVKNYWHSYLKKCPKSNVITTSELKSMPSPNDNIVEENTTNHLIIPDNSDCSTSNVGDEFPHILESSKLIRFTETSSEKRDIYYSSASSFEESTINLSDTKEDNFEESNISCPSTTEDNFEDSIINCLGTKEDVFAPWLTIFEELENDFWTVPFVSEAAYTTNEMGSSASPDMPFFTSDFYDETNLFYNNLEDRFD